MQKNFHIGKFFERASGGVYVWILLHARLELNAPSSYGLLVTLTSNCEPNNYEDVCGYMCKATMTQAIQYHNDATHARLCHLYCDVTKHSQTILVNVSLSEKCYEPRS